MENDNRNPVVFLLGSNMGNREENLASACRMLEKEIYYSAIIEQKWAENLTDKEPEELLTIAKAIEQQLGRDLSLPLSDESGRRIYRPRTIDIDIIFYGGLIYRSDDLVIPHPFYRERLFVLEPIAEAVPEYIDPLTGKTVAELLKELDKTV